MANKIQGCAYGQLTNQKVMDFKESVNAGFKRIETELVNINNKQSELFNYMSNRIPKGTVTVWCALIGVICTLIGVLGSFIIAGRIN